MSPALLALLCLAAPERTVHRSAVIVGVNESFDATQPALAYADDDAARYYELFEGQLDEVELLTVLDAESQGLYPQAAALARAPTEVMLAEVLARFEASAAKARGLGQKTELYFIYTGHGRTEGGEGEVRLLGGKLTRSALFERLLTRGAHDRIHLIVDACDAYHLVNARGPGERVTSSLDEVFERSLKEQSLARFPEAGAILSTRGRASTHEWSRYQGGVFSHEVRSALAGAADADGDGRVDYVELEAFLAAANAGVPELKGRPKVFVRPPAIERGAAVVELPRARPAITLAAPLAGRFWLEDQRGLRFAELHKAEGQAVVLFVLPDSGYEVYDGAGDRVAALGQGASGLEISPPLTPEHVARRSRGEEEPSGAFAEPFGPRYVEGFRARALISEAAPPREGENRTLFQVLGLGAGAVAVVLGSTAVWQQVEANKAYDRYHAPGMAEERDRYQMETEAARQRTLGLSIGAGVGAAAAAALLYLAWGE